MTLTLCVSVLWFVCLLVWIAPLFYLKITTGDTKQGESNWFWKWLFPLSPTRNMAESVSMSCLFLCIAEFRCVSTTAVDFWCSPSLSLFGIEILLSVFFLTVFFVVSQRGSFQPAILSTGPTSLSKTAVKASISFHACLIGIYCLLSSVSLYVLPVPCVSHACLSSWLVDFYFLVCLSSPLYALPSLATSVLLVETTSVCHVIPCYSCLSVLSRPCCNTSSPGNHSVLFRLLGTKAALNLATFFAILNQQSHKP